MNAAILVVGPSWVGDMVMAQSLFRLLKSRSPDRAIDVLAPGWSLPVIARMPEVRNGVDARTEHGELGLGKRRAIARRLRDERYGQAIVLPRSLKAALIPFLAGIPRRTGYRGETRYWLINDMRPLDPALDQTVKRFAALGLERNEQAQADGLPTPALRVDADNGQAVLGRLGLSVEQPVVALLPGAEYGPAKCWPLGHYTALANRLEEAGFATWILGSARDAPAGSRIAAGSRARNLCGKTSLEDAIDLLALCPQVVSNDSGLMHVAAAVGCHVHALYGSSTPDFTPPLTAATDIHYRRLDCSPCFQRRCPLGHLDCLQGISVDDVATRVLAGSGNAGNVGDEH